MRNTIFSLLVLLGLFSCDNREVPYAGKVYEFHSYSQDKQGIFLVLDGVDNTSLSLDSGSRGKNREQVKMVSLQYFLNTIDLRKIEFIDEFTLRFSYFQAGIFKQSILTIEEDQNLFDISEIMGESISYDRGRDEFHLCGVTSYVLGGLESISSDDKYNIFNLHTCIDSLELRDYIPFFISQNDLNKFDTIDIIVHDLYYK